MKKIYNLLVSVTVLVLFTTISNAHYDPSLEEKQNTAFKAYQLFLRSNLFLAASEFDQVASSVKKITILRSGNKSTNKLARRTVNLIEDRIVERMLNNQRFSVIECLECKSKKISFTDGALKIDEFRESNENLNKIGKKLDIDAFLFWDSFIDGSKIIITFRLIQSIDGKILWSKQYSSPFDPKKYSQHVFDIHVGLLGYSLKRTGSTSTVDTTVSNLAKAGIRFRERFSFLDNLEFSLGADVFGAITKMDNFDFIGGSLEARMVIDILPLMKHLKTNVYVGGGPAYYKDNLSAFLNYGIEIPFHKVGYISFGGTYFPKRDLTLKTLKDFNNDATFGGVSYELTLGIRL